MSPTSANGQGPHIQLGRLVYYRVVWLVLVPLMIMAGTLPSIWPENQTAETAYTIFSMLAVTVIYFGFIATNTFPMPKPSFHIGEHREILLKLLKNSLQFIVLMLLPGIFLLAYSLFPNELHFTVRGRHAAILSLEAFNFFLLWNINALPFLQSLLMRR